MSRRRKLGDSPGPKHTPRPAAEDCSSVVESGKRRLRAARGSGLRGAGEGPLQPVPPPEQPSVAASCGKSNPGWGGGVRRGLPGPRPCSPQPSWRPGSVGWAWGWRLQGVFLRCRGLSPREPPTYRAPFPWAVAPASAHCPVRSLRPSAVAPAAGVGVWVHLKEEGGSVPGCCSESAVAGPGETPDAPAASSVFPGRLFPLTLPAPTCLSEGTLCRALATCSRRALGMCLLPVHQPEASM